MNSKASMSIKAVMTTAFISALIAAFPATAISQVGGQTGGTLVIDDVENLTLAAEGVGRDWITDFTFTVPALKAIDPATESLVLASGQTPQGVFEFTANNDTAGFFSKTCGIPVPSQLGESTLTHPGDMTSFETLSFFACVNPTAANMELQVILECYPQNANSTFPKLYWFVTPSVGTTFEKVSLDLRSPDLVENNDGDRTVEELLSETRFLAFFLFAGPDFSRPEIRLYFDDITLTDEGGATSVGSNWVLYE
ncbi:MAG: hypothetical protein JJU11_06960 [Candidatus Sumerlaeia bacterium]|nr:hypothetical protein [Candidatus Sumerlaeia bacterium]